MEDGTNYMYNRLAFPQKEENIPYCLPKTSTSQKKKNKKHLWVYTSMNQEQLFKQLVHKY